MGVLTSGNINEVVFCIFHNSKSSNLVTNLNLFVTNFFKIQLFSNQTDYHFVRCKSPKLSLKVDPLVSVSFHVIVVKLSSLFCLNSSCPGVWLVGAYTKEYHAKEFDQNSSKHHETKKKSSDKKHTGSKFPVGACTRNHFAAVTGSNYRAKPTICRKRRYESTIFWPTGF